MVKTTKREQKRFKKYNKSRVELPNLVEAQLISYQSFVDKGISEVLSEFTPIEDYSGKNLNLNF